MFLEKLFLCDNAKTLDAVGLVLVDGSRRAPHSVYAWRV